LTKAATGLLKYLPSDQNRELANRMMRQRVSRAPREPISSPPAADVTAIPESHYRLDLHPSYLNLLSRMEEVEEADIGGVIGHWKRVIGHALRSQPTYKMLISRSASLLGVRVPRFEISYSPQVRAMIFSSLCKGRPFIHAPGKDLGDTLRRWLRYFGATLMTAELDNPAFQDDNLARPVARSRAHPSPRQAAT
jgi:hypothetical protein